MGQDKQQMILEHLEVIDGVIAQLRDVLNTAQPIGGSYFQEETVFVGKQRNLDRLQIISTSTWACRDLIEHE